MLNAAVANVSAVVIYIGAGLLLLPALADKSKACCSYIYIYI